MFIMWSNIRILEKILKFKSNNKNEIKAKFEKKINFKRHL